MVFDPRYVYERKIRSQVGQLVTHVTFRVLVLFRRNLHVTVTFDIITTLHTALLLDHMDFTQLACLHCCISQLQPICET